MGWFFSKSSDNELGEFLPDSEDELQEGSEAIKAKNPQEADKKCQEVASQYDAVSSKAVSTEEDDDTYDCRFKFWGKR